MAHTPSQELDAAAATVETLRNAGAYSAAQRRNDTIESALSELHSIPKEVARICMIVGDLNSLLARTALHDPMTAVAIITGLSNLLALVGRLQNLTSDQCVQILNDFHTFSDNYLKDR